MTEVLQAMACGFAFGFLLHKAGLTHYARIVNLYRLTDLSVIEFMLAALLVGAVLVQAGLSLGLVASVPIPRTALVANLVGGLVFGVGMATAGYCPGTIVAEAGEGRLDACSAGLSGLLCGGVLYGALQPVIMPLLARAGVLGRITFAELLGVSPWLLLLVFGELVALVLVVAARARSRRESSDQRHG